MDDVKDKMKGLMKKVNSQLSSSSSGKFKGQGRTLGSAPPSGPVNSSHSRLIHTPNPRPTSSSSSSSISTPSPPPQLIPGQSKPKPSPVRNPEPTSKPSDGFDPYGSLITSSKVSKNGFTLEVFECPVCGASYRSPEEVSEHVDSCLANGSAKDDGAEGDVSASPQTENVSLSKAELDVCVDTYLSQKPPEGSLDVILRLFRNIVKEPENSKFRKLRMSNHKIREAIGEVAGGIELLEFVGFELKEEDGEMWAVMDVPKQEQISLISQAVQLLERRDSQVRLRVETSAVAPPTEKVAAVEPIKVDRQIRVFFAVPENVAAKIVLPDSFYNLSLDEIKREADMRKKKMAESQLLIPKSFKEKQAKAARKRYRRAVVRVQFPDGVVLQGVFSPRETTTALYEFVSSALKEPCLEFELLDPVMVRRRVISRFAAPGERPRTLEVEDLVPSALIKFKPIETDSIVFTGLCNELLQIIEPLETDSAVLQPL